ncbi:MAG TPA: nucleotidyltransferase domain-containing protein [Spirochaetota bacterium]|nr:nucleotidyltransferase domain-containing protein [Spirochaetota bacterium]HPI90788.1 nucleotidyltransferase domain-containing protein [Spirochaetota bacterium]HPR47491.1 nucleotidyltransferase domain-containing protein [Spirochaetota bacterium]
MDKGTAIKKARDYLNEISKILPYQKAYLFGSHALGFAREESDIDIGIFVQELNGDYLSVLKSLYKIRRQIDVRIEPHLFITGKDDSGFSEEVENNGILIQ